MLEGSDVGSLAERSNIERVVTPVVGDLESSGSDGSMNFLLLLAFKYFSSEMTRDKWPRSVCNEWMDMALWLRAFWKIRRDW